MRCYQMKRKAKQIMSEDEYTNLMNLKAKDPDGFLDCFKSFSHLKGTNHSVQRRLICNYVKEMSRNLTIRKKRGYRYMTRKQFVVHKVCTLCCFQFLCGKKSVGWKFEADAAAEYDTSQPSLQSFPLLFTTWGFLGRAGDGGGWDWGGARWEWVSAATSPPPPPFRSLHH